MSNLSILISVQFDLSQYPKKITFYIDDEKFVKRINKFRKHRLNKRVEKITIKIKTIGIPNSEKKSKKINNKRGEDVKDVAAEKTNNGEIMGGEFGVCFLDFNDLTRDNIKEICSILEIQESFDADTKQDRDEEGDGYEIGDVKLNLLGRRLIAASLRKLMLIKLFLNLQGMTSKLSTMCLTIWKLKLTVMMKLGLKEMIKLLLKNL